MTVFAALSVWRHQVRRRLRVGSAAAVILELAYFGLAALFLLTAIYLLVAVLPGTDVVLEIDVNAEGWLRTHGVGLCAAVIVVNLWLSGQRQADFGAYKFFPLSIPLISVTLQVAGIAQVRYLALLALVAGLYLFTFGDVRPAHALSAVLTVFALDSLSLSIRLLAERHEKAIFVFTALLIAIVVCDAVASHFASTAVVDVFVELGTGTPLVVALTVALTAIGALATNKLIQEELRYGR